MALAVGAHVRLRPAVVARWSPWGFEASSVGQVVAIVVQQGRPAWLVVDWGPLGLVSQLTPGQLLET